MLVEISAIIINPRRRPALPEDVQKMAASMAEVGLLNPITLDKHYTLIAGLLRLEAAKKLAWTAIECTVSELDGLQAELAELDENFIRKDLSGVEYSDLLLRRKEIYESLNPITKHGGNRRGEDFKIAKCNLETPKSFIQDTADALGVHPSTVARQLQTAKNLTQEAKDILRASDTQISKKGAMMLSRLAPEQQKEAATMLASGEIRSMDDYLSSASPRPEAEASALPFNMDGKGKHFDSFEDSLADMKDPDKDCSATPDTFLTEISYFIRKFLKGLQWYDQDYYKAVFPLLNDAQMEYLHEQTSAVCTAVNDLYSIIERTRNK